MGKLTDNILSPVDAIEIEHNYENNLFLKIKDLVARNLSVSFFPVFLPLIFTLVRCTNVAERMSFAVKVRQNCFKLIVTEIQENKRICS